jgi:hypothetical protein
MRGFHFGSPNKQDEEKISVISATSQKQKPEALKYRETNTEQGSFLPFSVPWTWNTSQVAARLNAFVLPPLSTEC